MSLETCVACGADVHAWKDNFPLCKEHLREVHAIDRDREAERATAKRVEQLAKFRAAYPGIKVTT